MDPDFAKLEFPTFNPEESVPDETKPEATAAAPTVPWIGNLFSGSTFGLGGSPAAPTPAPPAETGAKEEPPKPEPKPAEAPAKKPRASKPVVVNVFSGAKPKKKAAKAE